MQNFHELKVYQKAYDLSIQVYGDMKDKDHHLKWQLIRSATSIPANISEMAAFDTDKHQAHKIRIAIGEANETEHWLTFFRDTQVLPKDKVGQYIDQIIEIRKMLLGLLKSIKE